MTTVLQLLRRVEQLPISDIAFNAIDQTLDRAADLQREQMRRGEDSEGEPISHLDGDPTYKSKGYAFHKRTLSTYNPVTGEIDLYLHGSFQNRIVANLIGEELVIESTDRKNDDLIGMFGRAIFGLNGEFHRKYVNGDLRPVAMSEVRRHLKLSA